MGRIIIVEDDENIRTLIREILTQEGHQVTTAADGREGLRHVQASGTDLVITDIFMPEQDGFELIMEMRQSYPQIKIIAMSGDLLGPQFGSLRIAQQLGAHEILHKPFHPHELVEMVNRALEQEE